MWKRKDGIDLVKRELKRVREQRLSPAKLAAAKRQFMGQIEVSTDQKNKPCQCSAEPDRDQLRAAQLKDQGKANAAKSCHNDL